MSTGPGDNDPEVAYTNLFTYAELLQTPELAQLYTTILRHGPMTVDQIKTDTDLPHSTAYKYVGQLEEMGILSRDQEAIPATVTVDSVRLAVEVDDGHIVVTPTFIAAIGAQTESEEIALFVDRHGVGKLGAALHYTFRVRAGDLTQRTVASRLDIHPVEAMTIVETLQTIIDEVSPDDPHLSLDTN